MDLTTTWSPSSVSATGGRLILDAGEQNYGTTAVRINQPFQGTQIELDLDPTQISGGWPQVSFTDQALPYVSFFEDNTAGPRVADGFLLQFRANERGCIIAKVWRNGSQVLNQEQCIWRAVSGMKHVVIRPSATGLQIIYDGTTLNYAQGLAISRGHLYLEAHNHASEKDGGVPTFTAEFDNVTFDGSVLPLLNVALPPHNLPASPTDPRLVLLAQHGNFDASPSLSYRLNGGPLHGIPLVRASGQVGAYMVSVTVDPAELVVGNNTVTLVPSGMTQQRFSNIQIVWSGAGAPPPPTTTTSTLVAGTTTVASTTTSTTTSAPQAGLLYQNSFNTTADLDRLMFDLHRGAPWAIPSDVLTFNGDHDMTCGAPTTTRVVHESTKPEWVWHCAVADPHFMTGMNTNSYNIISFAPINPNSNNVIFPATANRVCWSQNITGLGGRKWVNVVVVSDDRHASRGGDLSYVTPDHSGNGGTPGFPSDPVAAVVGGDDFAFVNLKNTVTYYSPSGHQYSHTILDNVTDKAARFRHCLKDNGNGTVTRTQARPGGAVSTVTMAGRFPTGPRVFIIEDVSYSPDKAGDDVVSDPYTWHWDNIEVAAA